MMDFIFYILTGVLVGFAIGMTGVGGGSLMTPLLLMFGFPVSIAIGTDLMYAGIAKSVGVYVHAKKQNVNWPVMGAMALGSLPSALISIWGLSHFQQTEHYFSILNNALGAMLLITAVVIVFRNKLTRKSRQQVISNKHGLFYIFICGLILGCMVTLTSVGAGALGTAMLMILFPVMSARHIIGTDLAHAVPLTLVAGFGHMTLGNVDYSLLLALLIGSIPAIYLGTYVANYMPNKILQPVLAMVLSLFGIKYLFF